MTADSRAEVVHSTDGNPVGSSYEVDGGEVPSSVAVGRPRDTRTGRGAESVVASRPRMAQVGSRDGASPEATDDSTLAMRVFQWYVRVIYSNGLHRELAVVPGDREPTSTSCWTRLTTPNRPLVEAAGTRRPRWGAQPPDVAASAS